jgi:hypothetical protein
VLRRTAEGGERGRAPDTSPRESPRATAALRGRGVHHRRVILADVGQDRLRSLEYLGGGDSEVVRRRLETPCRVSFGLSGKGPFHGRSRTDSVAHEQRSSVEARILPLLHLPNGGRRDVVPLLGEPSAVSSRHTRRRQSLGARSCIL